MELLGYPLWLVGIVTAVVAALVGLAVYIYSQPQPRSKIDLEELRLGLLDKLQSVKDSGVGGESDEDGDGFFSGPMMKYGLPTSVFIVGGYALLRLGPSGFITPDRVIYFGVFLFSAMLVPGIIALNGPALSTLKLDGALGKVNWTLGMLTFGVGILVQRENGNYEMWPARIDDGKLELYLDGKWKTIDGNEHLSRLGWRPFGIHYEKTTKALKPYLEHFGDDGVVSDGGETVLGGGLRDDRAGIEEAGPKRTKDYHWLVDAVRVIPRKSAAGAALINRAEVIEIAKQNSGGRLASWSNVIGAVAGLIIGGIMAYIIFSPG